MKNKADSFAFDKVFGLVKNNELKDANKFNKS